MKKFLPAFFTASLLLLFSTAYAQDPMLFIYRPHWPVQENTFHNALSFSGEYTAGSDGLTNSFINNFYKGGYIDADTKTKQENLLLPSNRFGGYAAYGFAYCWRTNPDSAKWEFNIAYRDRQSLYGKFSPDAFKLAFEGNRPFAGKSAHLDETRFTYLHWQQLQFEAKYYSPDKRSDATFGFSVLNGQQLQEVNIRKVSVFTASDGTAIDITSDATYYSSDTSAHKTGTHNGSGTCFNFRFNTYLGDSAAHYRHQVSFFVQDLGFIRWNNQSQVYNVDTSLHFTGVDASSLILNNGQVSGLPNSDSLIGKPQNGQIITFLPLGLRFRYTLLTPFAWWGGIDARAWSYSDAAAHFTLFGGWHSRSFKFNATGGAAWGGYARLQFPLQVGWEVCKYFNLIAGTTNAAAYIVPKKTHGQGLYLNVSFAF